MPLAGHLKNFLKSWKILIRDQETFSAVKGHNIVLTTILHQEKIPGRIHMGAVQKSLVNMNISKMFIKGAIPVAQKYKESSF